MKKFALALALAATALSGAAEAKEVYKWGPHKTWPGDTIAYCSASKPCTTRSAKALAKACPKGLDEIVPMTGGKKCGQATVKIGACSGGRKSKVTVDGFFIRICGTKGNAASYF